MKADNCIALLQQMVAIPSKEDFFFNEEEY